MGINNPPHVDRADGRRGSVVFVDRENYDIVGHGFWYFLFPEFQVKVQLADGLVINWDAR